MQLHNNIKLSRCHKVKQGQWEEHHPKLIAIRRKITNNLKYPKEKEKD